MLTQVASTLNLEKLEHFSMAHPANTCGISHIIFQMSPPELDHSCNAFRNLTAIELKINRHSQYLETNWHETRDSLNIARVLSTARSLARLELSFDACSIAIPRLEVLFGGGIWPNLRYLRVGGMIVKEDQFGDFLNRHKESIRHLRSEYMLLSKDGPECVVDPLKTWKGLYCQISDLSLTHLGILSYTWPRSSGLSIAIGLALTQHRLRGFRSLAEISFTPTMQRAWQKKTISGGTQRCDGKQMNVRPI